MTLAYEGYECLKLKLYDDAVGRAVLIGDSLPTSNSEPF